MFALFILLHYHVCYVDNTFICSLAYQCISTQEIYWYIKKIQIITC